MPLGPAREDLDEGANGGADRGVLRHPVSVPVFTSLGRHRAEAQKPHQNHRDEDPLFRLAEHLSVSFLTTEITPVAVVPCLCPGDYDSL